MLLLIRLTHLFQGEWNIDCCAQPGCVIVMNMKMATQIGRQLTSHMVVDANLQGHSYGEYIFDHAWNSLAARLGQRYCESPCNTGFLESRLNARAKGQQVLDLPLAMSWLLWTFAIWRLKFSAAFSFVLSMQIRSCNAVFHSLR